MGNNVSVDLSLLPIHSLHLYCIFKKDQAVRYLKKLNFDVTGQNKIIIGKGQLN